jgi:hypothetical protein
MQNKITMHERVIPVSAMNTISKQGMLDATFACQPCMPIFSMQNLLDYVVELIVSEDKAFWLIDRGPF